MPLNPMMFVSDAPTPGPIRGIGSGLIAGADAVHGRKMDQERNALAARNTAVQEGYLQRNLSSDKREADSVRNAQVEALVAEFRDASRRGDSNAMRAARDKLERNGISVLEASETTVSSPDLYDLSPDLESKPLETPDPHVYDSSIEGMLIENTPQEQSDSRAMSAMLEPAPPTPEMDVTGLGELRSVMPSQEQSAPEGPPPETRATGYRLVDKATGKELGDVGLEGDVNIGAGNVGKVFQSFIQNARSPEHRKAAETAQTAAQAMVPILGEAKAIEYGQKIYETEAGRIDKVTAGRGIGGVGGAGNAGGFGMGKADLGARAQLSTIEHRVIQQVAGHEKLPNISNSEQLLTEALEQLNRGEGMGDQQAIAGLLKRMSGATLNVREIQGMDQADGKFNQAMNTMSAWFGDASKTEETRKSLRDTITVALKNIQDHKLGMANDAARRAQGDAYIRVLPDHEKLDSVRAVYAYFAGNHGPWGEPSGTLKPGQEVAPPKKAGGKPAAKPAGNQSRIDRLKKLAGD